MKVHVILQHRKFVAFLLVLAVSESFAASISSDEASLAVKRWLANRHDSRYHLGSSVAGARTYRTTNDVSFHVINLSGGGFVVTSSDTDIEPIIAFSDTDEFAASPANPLWTMLCNDLPRRHEKRSTSFSGAKWTSLLAQTQAGTNGLSTLTYAATGQTSLSDVRVAPLLETKWNQEKDSGYTNTGNPCYNYYTPENYPCGCVATAMAQIMRYHKYPTLSVTPATYTCSIVTGQQWMDRMHYREICEPCELTLQGGTYDWAKMPAVPANGTTLEQRMAIGKLTSDVGIACLMQYGEDASSASGYMPALALPRRFLYANAAAAVRSRGYGASFIRAVLIPNLDAKLPVLVGLSGTDGGHAVVADGYGYDSSTLYVHFNLGWSGKNDAWYAPPEVENFYAIESLVYNVYPTGESGGVICSGRVLNENGLPVAGTDVLATNADDVHSVTTDAMGIYAFILQPGNYALSTEGAAPCAVTLAANVSIDITDDGSYYERPEARVNNLYDCDFTVTGKLHTVTSVPAIAPEEDLAFNANAAYTYDGIIADTNGMLKGYVTVKITKATGQGSSQTTKITATIQMAGETKKITVKGNASVSKATMLQTLSDGRLLGLSFTQNGLSGTFNGYQIEGVRNLSASCAVLQGNYALACADTNGWMGLSVSVMTKGKVKVSGKRADGTSVSVSSQLISGSDYSVIPILYTKKNTSLAFSIYFANDGTDTKVWGCENAMIAPVTNLNARLTFSIEGIENLFADGYTLCSAFLPCGIAVEPNDKQKWVVANGAKAGSIKVKNGEVVDTKNSANPSGLKLTYNAKQGTFSGSFKVYALDDNNKLKTFTASVSGVVVDGLGYGAATIRNRGSCAVVIEK